MLPLRTYVISLGVGLVFGILYNLIRVPSPAPPVIALLGLLGIYLGIAFPCKAGMKSS